MTVSSFDAITGVDTPEVGVPSLDLAFAIIVLNRSRLDGPPGFGLDGRLFSGTSTPAGRRNWGLLELGRGVIAGVAFRVAEDESEILGGGSVEDSP